jgi:hypothetical protein
MKFASKLGFGLIWFSGCSLMNINIVQIRIHKVVQFFILTLFFGSFQPICSQPITEITDPDVLNFNYGIGTQTIGPSYGFTSNDRLVETAQAILNMGSNILKINLGTNSYSITGRPAYRTLTELVRDDPSFSKVLDMPFTYFFFWARSNADWADGYSTTERSADSLQLAELTTYLLTMFNNTGKQFFLGHWEGDWYLLTNYDASYVPSDTRCNNMIQWYNARQNAIDEAKEVTIHNNVEVFSYCEVNRVVDAKNGLRRVVNKVLPFSNVDYVSYSSYDAQGLSQTEFNNVLNYIEGNLPPKPQIQGKRVFIGEIGRNAADFSFSKMQHESVNRDNIRKALLWGCPFVLYWEMYNNEIANNVQKGFCLIDDKNTKWPLYYTYSDFYIKAKEWVASQKILLNRLPSSEEYKAWAYNNLIKGVSTNTYDTEKPINSDVEVYPNPITDNICIASKINIIEKISLINLNGLVQKIEIQKTPGTFFINSSALSAGIYLLSIQTENEQVVKKVFIK